MSADDKAVRTIPFTGKKEDYTIWAARFLSYAHMKGCKAVLLGTTAIPKATARLVVGTHDADIMTRKANDTAYSMLTMAVTDAVSFGAVYNAQTTDLPDGDSMAAWTNLEKIFKPTHSTKKHELEQAFNSCALLQESKNPDEWFAELQKIRLQLKMDFQVTYDDDKVISHMLFNIKPKGYETIVAIIKRDLNKGVAVTLDDVQEDIRQVYGQLNKGGSLKNKLWLQAMASLLRRFLKVIVVFVERKDTKVLTVGRMRRTRISVQPLTSHQQIGRAHV